MNQEVAWVLLHQRGEDAALTESREAAALPMCGELLGKLGVEVFLSVYLWPK